MRSRSEAAAPDGLPPGWAEEEPAASRLATAPAYDLTHSTSFLLKGHSYGRFVVRVPVPLDNVQVFFTTAAQFTGNGPKPSLEDPDAYHFEFIQVRPLGHAVTEHDVDAVTHFAHAEAKGVYTLTYLYGRGANYEFLAPYEGRPDAWHFDAGYYDVVVATDEKLTVGVNVKTGSAYWSTIYHPQELGTARAEALGFSGTMDETLGGRLPDESREQRGVVRAAEGERLDYFAFADVWYDTKGLTVGPTGTATVTVNGDPVPHQLVAPPPASPGHAEAYAFATGFNVPGPAKVDLASALDFHEQASVRSTLVVMAFVFGVATIPEQTLAGLPATSELGAPQA